MCETPMTLIWVSFSDGRLRYYQIGGRHREGVVVFIGIVDGYTGNPTGKPLVSMNLYEEVHLADIHLVSRAIQTKPVHRKLKL